jgi:hypothetical protein
MLRASRRNRLRQLLEEHLALAARFKDDDPDTARRFRELAAEDAHLLIRRDQRWLQQGRISPTTIVTIMVLVTPSVIVILLSRQWEGTWIWPIRVLAIVWALLWGGVGLTQLREDREDEEAEAATRRP